MKKIFIYLFIIIFSLTGFSYANTDVFVYKSKTYIDITTTTYRYGRYWYKLEEKENEILINTLNDDVFIVQQGALEGSNRYLYLYFIDYNDDFNFSNSNIILEQSEEDTKLYYNKAFRVLDKTEFLEYYEDKRKDYDLEMNQNLNFDLDYKKVIITSTRFMGIDNILKLTFQYYREKE